MNLVCPNSKEFHLHKSDSPGEVIRAKKIHMMMHFPSLKTSSAEVDFSEVKLIRF